MNGPRAAKTVFLVGALCALAGCAVPAAVVASAGITAAQEGAAVFIRGELRTAMRQPYVDIHDAAVGSLLELGFQLRRETAPTERSAYIEATTDTGARVSVRIAMVTEVVSTIRIRVGTVGDKEVASLILVEMNRRLHPDVDAP